MKYLLLLILMLTGCFHYETPPSWHSHYVYEDQYILEAKGEWCPWEPGVRSCPKVFPPGQFVNIDGEYQPLQLVQSKTGIIGLNKIVPYNPKFDKCRKEYKGFDCSPNYVMHVLETPNDKSFSALWGLNSAYGIRAKEAWEKQKFADNIVVAVIDSGIDVNHPDLKNNIWGTYNAINGSSTIIDHVDHGTHVAGTICAEGNNAIGVSGVAWRCKLLGIKFLGKDGSGSTYHAVKGVNYVTNLARKHKNLRFVINGSFGGGGATRAMQSALVRANQAGVVFVAAAGNERNNNDRRPSYPANYRVPNMISVAAIDNKGRLANFSNYGRSTVHIAAPGVNIFSTIPNNKYGMMSGTSMAAPHVAGVIALMLAQNPTLTVAQIKSNLFQSGNILVNLRGRIQTEKTINLNGALNE